MFRNRNARTGTGSEVVDMTADRAGSGSCALRFGSGWTGTVREEDGELAPRRHRDVAVAVLHVSRGHPSLWYWMIWFTKCTDRYASRIVSDKRFTETTFS